MGYRPTNARPALPSGWVVTSRKRRAAMRRSRTDHTKWRHNPRSSRKKNNGLLTSTHHHPANVRPLPGEEALTAHVWLLPAATLISEARESAYAKTRQTISATRESLCLSAAVTAAAAASKDAGDSSGALVNCLSVCLSCSSTRPSASVNAAIAITNLAQTPRSRRYGRSAADPMARPSAKLSSIGTPQASATKITARRPACSECC